MNTIAGHVRIRRFAGPFVAIAAALSGESGAIEATFGGGSSALEAVAVGLNGEIIVAGALTVSRSDEEFDEDAYLAAFDRDGNKLWEEYFGDTGTDAFRTVTVLADGGLLLGGEWGIPGEFLDSYCWVMRLDSNRDVVWQQTFETGDNCNLEALDMTAEDGIAIAGSEGLVARLAHDGEIIWYVQVESVGSGFYGKFRTVTQLPNGRVVVGGVTQVQSDDGSEPGLGTWMLVFADDGTTYVDLATPPGWSLVRAEPSTNGVWLTAIREQELMAAEINVSCECLSQNTFGFVSELPELPEVNATLRESDGSLLLAGYGRREPPGDRLAEDLFAFAGSALRDTDGWLAKIGPAGEKVWETTFGGKDESESVAAIAALPQGGYVVVGTRGGGGFASATSAWLITLH